MPKKKTYMAKTYGMRKEEYLKLLNKQVKKAKDCEGYEEFKEDIKILKKTLDKRSGKPSLLSNIWIKRVCEMDNEQLFKLVNNYKKGDFDPYQFEPQNDK